MTWKNLYAQYADMFMILKLVIRITESSLAQHGKMFLKIGFVHSAA